MFWDRFFQLCVLHNSKPNPVAKELGFSSGVVTKWKNGSIPNGEMLLKIADYFDVSVDYLLGRSDSPEMDIKKEAAQMDSLSRDEKESEVIHLYNQLSPARQERALLALYREIEQQRTKDQADHH